MKKKLGVLLGLMVALASGLARAAGTFEGEVDMKMTHAGSDKSMVMQYFVKGHKMRTKIEEKDGMVGGGVYDWQSHEMIILMDKQKMYMVSKRDPARNSLMARTITLKSPRPGTLRKFWVTTAGNMTIRRIRTMERSGSLPASETGGGRKWPPSPTSFRPSKRPS